MSIESQMFIDGGLLFIVKLQYEVRVGSQLCESISVEKEFIILTIHLMV